METLKIGIREFREKLASYLLESDVPVAITRHGDTVGYYIPARRKRSEGERAALQEAAGRWQKILAAEGIGEDEVIADFKKWRADKRRCSAAKRLVLDANILLRGVFGVRVREFLEASRGLGFVLHS